MDTIETPIYNDATIRSRIDTMSLNGSKTDGQSDVMRQVTSYDSNVNKLREIIGLLEDKIANVLSVDSGDTERATAPTSSNKSNLASMLNDLNERLAYCTDRLESVIQRVDL